MKEQIRLLLSEALPGIDLDSDFLFGSLDSLGVVTILVVLSREYNISLDSTDVTPKNFRSLDSLAKMVETKLSKSE